jgi:nitrite reductase (NADH) large subunit
MVIGEVAKKFDLYIQNYGSTTYWFIWATLNDLPEIWRILIDNGFESGHARKIIRAVKKLWVTLGYGMDDSTTFAIELETVTENSFSSQVKGVSACIRECAEARGKILV